MVSSVTRTCSRTLAVAALLLAVTIALVGRAPVVFHSVKGLHGYYMWRTSDLDNPASLSPSFLGFREVLRLQHPLTDYMTLSMSRTFMDGLVDIVPPAEDATFEPAHWGGRDRGEWVLAPNVSNTTDAPTLLYLHGGGYVAGSPYGYRGWTSELSRLTQMRVLALDYRRAPEDPLPAAVDDAVEAVRYALVDLGVPPSSFVIGGDSAGGGLTLLTLQALAKGDVLVAGAFVLSPFTDLTTASPMYTSHAHLDDLVSPGLLRFMATHAVGDISPTSPVVSPKFGSFEGFPPTYIVVGSDEILLGDSLALAANLKDAKAQVTLEVGQSMFHIFPFFYPYFDEARHSADKIGVFVRQVMRWE